MKLKYTILYVENVEQTLEFYENAFGLKRAMLHEGGDYAELDTGNTTLSFSSLDLMNRLGKGAQRPTKGKPNFEIAFETDDVAGSLQKALDAGAELVQPVEEMPWGQTTSYVHDINGFLIEICSPVSGA
ncbi:putative Glyoxalase/Bleomycin resistance protein/Dihydroxybiphenyl dioxygenase [Vibrio nigripulchritudo SOn1]|uniref:Glyoxalase/Bleomycin resistance protein/Dihydroxybiphenyl dioxygenase n=1 Tax=Vibrio nigripulchritudo SOn1 TaxID=1238450 RepID=A0AAV2VY43_9VIBR|nr:VOC family protein [Vibrio nigripulchritudo]CCO49679.1 putative Glyoxalase/Bleomycin resistance protein/Dihydroxybiphenyl dioxygenase [Vibrio nigripulchritudo SOn1]